jgi:hypothetical protein
MAKSINFLYCKGPYASILDSFIDPICKHLDEYTKGGMVQDAINVSFFTGTQSEVFMSHGIADKNWRNAGSVEKFEHVFVSGPLWVEKLIEQGLDKNKIVIGGYPKLDPCFNGEHVKTPSDKIVVLWAPTHNSLREVSSYPAFEEYLDKFPDDFEVISSVHPYHKEGKQKPTIQGLVDADVVIADAGSTAYEAWALGKQVIFPDWLIKDGICKRLKNTFEAQIFKNRIGLHANSFEELVDMAYSSAKEPLDMITEMFIDTIFPKELRGISGKVTAERLMAIAKGEEV